MADTAPDSPAHSVLNKSQPLFYAGWCGRCAITHVALGKRQWCGLSGRPFPDRIERRRSSTRYLINAFQINPKRPGLIRARFSPADIVPRMQVREIGFFDVSAV